MCSTLPTSDFIYLRIEKNAEFKGRTTVRGKLCDQWSQRHMFVGLKLLFTYCVHGREIVNINATSPHGTSSIFFKSFIAKPIGEEYFQIPTVCMN